MSNSKANIIDFDEIESAYRQAQIMPLVDDTLNVDFYDFGNGLEPAHRHPNGRGIIANTAQVDRSVYVGMDCTVSGNAIIKGEVSIIDSSSIEDNVVIKGEGKGVVIDDNSCIYGDVSITGSYTFKEANISGKYKFANTGKRSIKHFKLLKF